MPNLRSYRASIVLAVGLWAVAMVQLTLAITPAPATSLLQTAPTSEQLELGEEIYSSQCEPCHGSGGKGDGPASRFQDPKPRDLTSGRWLYAGEGSLEEIAAVVTHGVADTGMEPFGEILTEEEILAAAAYVRATFAPSDE